MVLGVGADLDHVIATIINAAILPPAPDSCRNGPYTQITITRTLMSLRASLIAQSCRPLRGESHRLSQDDIAGYLAEFSEWSLIEEGAAISRTLAFDDYYRTMAFVNALAFMAHAEDHHPDLGVHYNRCVVRYSTHDVGGLSLNDFICAAKLDSLLPQR